MDEISSAYHQTVHEVLPHTAFHQKYDFTKLIRFLFAFRWWVGSLQFRTTLFIHTVSSIPRDSSVLFSSFSTRSMVFAYFAKAQLPFSLFRDLFNDTAEFTLCYGLHDCSHLFQGYFIHSLSTLYYYNAPSLATLLSRILSDSEPYHIQSTKKEAWHKLF